MGKSWCGSWHSADHALLADPIAADTATRLFAGSISSALSARLVAPDRIGLNATCCLLRQRVIGTQHKSLVAILPPPLELGYIIGYIKGVLGGGG